MRVRIILISNLYFFKKNVLDKSLIALFAMGLFSVNMSANNQISSTKSKRLISKPISTLSDDEYDLFMLGKSFFRIPWVEAPSSTTARDGLGPLFNANTCIGCHTGNGRGRLYNKNGNFARSLIPKLSLRIKDKEKYRNILEKKGLVPEPTYGDQISIAAVHGLKFEGRTGITFKKIKVKFPDGEIDEILKPIYALRDLEYGKLNKDVILTFRIAPSLNGLGLLANISNKDILKNVDEFDKNKDGISGRANYVFSPISKKNVLGRYSWKASIGSIKHQVSNAANNDMGLTTKYYQNETCTKKEIQCNKLKKASSKIDLSEKRLDAIVFYLKHRKTYSAKRTKSYKKGLAIFNRIACNKCHIESFITKFGIKIAPFTDLLLHDMGKELADGREEFRASGQEFRTPPLWGLTLHEKINHKKPRLLHDGRARNFQEAILWHGGEALRAKKAYMNLSKKEREELLKFLKEV